MFDSGGLVVGNIVIIILLFGDQSRTYKDAKLNLMLRQEEVLHGV